MTNCCHAPVVPTNVPLIMFAGVFGPYALITGIALLFGSAEFVESLEATEIRETFETKSATSTKWRYLLVGAAACGYVALMAAGMPYACPPKCS